MSSWRLYLVHMVMGMIPPTRLFPMKSALLRWAGARVGKNVRIVSSARFHLIGVLSIGDGTWIGEDVRVIGGAAPVSIGRDVDIGPRVTLVTGTHALWGSSGRAAGQSFSLPITIADGAWLGACATILPGVEVGPESMVAAGALVTESVPPKTLVVGVPARLVRQREHPPRGTEVGP